MGWLVACGAFADERAPCYQSAVVVCAAQNVSGTALTSCVFDVCQTGDAGVVQAYQKVWVWHAAHAVARTSLDAAREEGGLMLEAS